MLKKHSALPAILMVLLGACSEGDRNADSGSQPVAPAREAALIDNEDLSPGLKGIDADGNGIRDDIDRLIAKKYSATSVIRKIAEQHARALQQAMEATTCEQAKTAGEEIFRAEDCASKYLPHANEADMKARERMAAEIEALTANTKERLIAHWKGDALSSGMIFRSNKNPACDLGK